MNGAACATRLLNAVNLDSAFYRLPTAEQLAAYAADVPENFRFMVKAYAGLTALPDSSMALKRRVEPVFLDAGFATRQVVKPLVDSLGAKLGATLFRASPGSRSPTSSTVTVLRQ